MDGQTDTFLIASPRWHSMQCGKKTIGPAITENTMLHVTTSRLCVLSFYTAGIGILDLIYSWHLDLDLQIRT